MERTESGVATLAGVDTLYYFADIQCDNYTKMWEEIKEGVYKTGFDFLGFSGKTRGFIGAWFEYKADGVPMFRVGFKDPAKQKQVKNVYVQLEATGIYSKGLEDLLLMVEELFSADFKISGYQVSRADLNMFVNYDFGSVDWKNFRSRTVVKKSTYSEDVDVPKDGYVYFTKRLETLYLGSKSSPISFKIYDKLLELRKKASSKNEDSINKYLIMLGYFRHNGINTNKPIWNIEFTLRREGLVQYGVDTVSDLLEKAGSIFSDLMTKYVFLDADDVTIDRYRQTKSLNKLPMAPIWEHFKNSYTIYKRKRAYRTTNERKQASKEHRLHLIRQTMEKAIEAEIEITLHDLTTMYYEVERLRQSVA